MNQVGGQQHYPETDATAHAGNSASPGRTSQGLPAPNPLGSRAATLQNGSCTKGTVHNNNQANLHVANTADQALAQAANHQAPVMADLDIKAILLNAEVDSLQLAVDEPQAAVDNQMNFDMPDLDLDALLGDIFTAKPDAVIDKSAVSVHGGTQVVHLAGLVDLNNNMLSLKDTERCQLSKAKNGFEAEYLTNMPGFPDKHVMFTSSDKPLTKEAVATYEKLAQDFHAANPHIPRKPLVIVVLDTNTWDKFQVSLSLHFAGHENKITSSEKVIEKAEVSHSNIKKNAPLSDQKPMKKHSIDRLRSNLIEFGFEIQKLVSKILKQMQKIGDEEAVAKRDAIKRDYIAREKEHSFRQSDDVKHDQRNWEANKRDF